MRPKTNIHRGRISLEVTTRKFGFSNGKNPLQNRLKPVANDFLTDIATHQKSFVIMGFGKFSEGYPSQFSDRGNRHKIFR